MKLFLMRHGIAEPFGIKPDEQRILTERGRTLVAAQFKACASELSIEQIIHSPYQRTTETAQIGAQLLNVKTLVSDERLTPEADIQLALELLETYADIPTLYVTHNPFVGRLIGLLCEGSSRFAEPMDTGMLAAIETDWPASGLGRLIWKRPVPGSAF